MNEPLTADEVRSVLRECVTVVKPGELLILLVSAADFTPDLLREYNEMLTWWVSEYAPGVRILAVIGEGGQILRQETPLAERVRAMATSPRPGGRRG